MFLGDHAGLFEACHDGSIRSDHLRILSALYRFNEDGIAVDLDQYHDVFIAS